MNLPIDAIILYLISSVVAQTQSSSGKLDSCNVVCNCNSDRSTDVPTDDFVATQGIPGKRGSKGDQGPVGSKGQKGDSGSKGQKGRNGEDLPISDVLSALSATSCQELRSIHGLQKPGYYLMRDQRTGKAIYRYCDFTIYTGYTSCDDLISRHNISETGYYILGNNTENAKFELCIPSSVGIYTCQALSDRYEAANSRYYKLNFPGPEVLRVFCNFSNRELVSTEVHHDLTDETKVAPPCDTAGCNVVTPTYELRESLIRSIIDKSTYCRQFIKLKCRGSLIKGYAWWISRQGLKMTYWGGSTKSGYCACGENRTCIDNTKKCNCDQNSNSITTSDEGYLTDKDSLPLKEMRIGDVGDPGEAAWYTIGKLECFG